MMESSIDFTPGHYIAIPVADCKRRPFMHGGKTYELTTCTACKAPVWAQLAHVEDRIIICWRCRG